jgi:kynurenine formamidase
MPKTLILMLTFCTLLSCQQFSAGTEHRPFSSGHWVDLSYSFSGKTPYWPTAESFVLDTAFEGITETGYYYSAYNFKAAEHGGTHMDAPVHFAQGKWTTDAVPLENLTGSAVMVDISAQCAANRDYQLVVADLEAWEKSHGTIPDGAILIIKTGFGKFYPDAEKYMGTAERGPAAVAKLHFPGIHPDAAQWLVKNRKVKAVGLDTPSLDFGQTADFKTHQVLNGSNICGFENMANLEALPVSGAYIVALPMKIEGGSGAPLRVIAWVED